MTMCMRCGKRQGSYEKGAPHCTCQQDREAACLKLGDHDWERYRSAGGLAARCRRCGKTRFVKKRLVR